MSDDSGVQFVGARSRKVGCYQKAGGFTSFGLFAMLTPDF